jgi:hypothetical protein
MNSNESTTNLAASRAANPSGTQASENRPAPVLLLVIGSVLFVIGAVWVGRTAEFIRRAERVPGVIVRVELVKSKNTTGHFPVFAFTNSAGIAHTVRSTTGFGVSFRGPGQKVMVLCDPAAPENARIESAMGIWFEPVGLTAFSLAMAGTGAFRLWRARRAA